METHHSAAEEAEGTLPFHARSITVVLRWLGAITLLAAAGSYLVSSWMEAAPLTRFYVFLAFTALLAVAGTFCGLRWREDKGARTFLALSALFVPACTAQLAAFLAVQLSGPAAPYEIFRISPIGESALLLAGFAGALVALPVIFLAFSALARPEAGRLSLAYLTGNLVLLLPQRDPNTVAAIAAGLLGFLLLLDRRFFARAAMLKHRDGVTMRLALLLPLLILVGRSLMLHGGSPVLVGFVLVSFGGFMFLGWPSCCTSDGLKTLVRLFGFGMVAIGWAVVTDWILKAIDWDSSEPVITVGLLPIAGAALLLSTRAGNDGRTYRRLASAGAMAAMLFHLTTFGGVGSILLALGMAVAMVAGAFWVTDRTILISGVMGFVFTLLYGLFMVREFWAQNLWVSLSALGVAILITSSLIERNWQRLTQRGTELVEGWQSWD